MRQRWWLQGLPLKALHMRTDSFLLGELDHFDPHCEVHQPQAHRFVDDIAPLEPPAQVVLPCLFLLLPIRAALAGFPTVEKLADTAGASAPRWGARTAARLAATALEILRRAEDRGHRGPGAEIELFEIRCGNAIRVAGDETACV